MDRRPTMSMQPVAAMGVDGFSLPEQEYKSEHPIFIYLFCLCHCCNFRDAFEFSAFIVTLPGNLVAVSAVTPLLHFVLLSS
ncbi:hypothetical protein A4A49_43821 [Nicotiana attenuata]|uniref:Uncharacterized protein n=1 Tax=Nicotiana attenuata TaxID=49451 RepID=A0A1J6KC36_NICAT|nr:hypothetical protein A4A49_43821 [Nicotiana attenuata]